MTDDERDETIAELVTAYRELLKQRMLDGFRIGVLYELLVQKERISRQESVDAEAAAHEQAEAEWSKVAPLLGHRLSGRSRGGPVH